MKVIIFISNIAESNQSQNSLFHFQKKNYFFPRLYNRFQSQRKFVHVNFSVKLSLTFKFALSFIALFKFKFQ
jgi:hypothetical protein